MRGAWAETQAAGPPRSHSALGRPRPKRPATEYGAHDRAAAGNIRGQGPTFERSLLCKEKNHTSPRGGALALERAPTERILDRTRHERFTASRVKAIFGSSSTRTRPLARAARAGERQQGCERHARLASDRVNTPIANGAGRRSGSRRRESPDPRELTQERSGASRHRRRRDPSEPGALGTGSQVGFWVADVGRPLPGEALQRASSSREGPRNRPLTRRAREVEAKRRCEAPAQSEQSARIRLSTGCMQTACIGAAHDGRRLGTFAGHAPHRAGLTAPSASRVLAHRRLGTGMWVPAMRHRDVRGGSRPRSRLLQLLTWGREEVGLRAKSHAREASGRHARGVERSVHRSWRERIAAPLSPSKRFHSRKRL